MATRSYFMRKTLFVVAAALSLFFFLPHTGQAAAKDAPITESALQDTLRELFRQHPELVLDVLREHSIDVLEIAQKGSEEKQFKRMRDQWQEDVKRQLSIKYDRPILGNEKAPVTIVAYSDYTCPYCADAALTIRKVMEARKNQVRFIFKNYPRRDVPLARVASEYVTAALVLDPQKGWEFHDVVFSNQVRLLKEGEGFLRAEALALGFNLQKLSAEVKGKTVQSIIDGDILEAQENGVPGTPFHMVNNLSIRGGMPLSAFLEAVDTALAAKKSR